MRHPFSWCLALTALLLVACSGPNDTIPEPTFPTGMGQERNAPSSPSETLRSDTVASEHGEGFGDVKICLQPINVEEFDIAAGVATLKLTLARHTAQQPEWQRYVKGTVTVVGGCQVKPAWLQPEARPPAVDDLRLERLERPPEYRTYVIVLESEEIQRLLAGSTNRVAPQAVQCQGHSCWEVGTALYLSVEEFQNPDYVSRGLLRALGLRNP